MNFNMKTAMTREEALKDLYAHWEINRQTELVPLEEALGRVTAEAIVSENTLPVYRVSAFDGYAVRSADFENGMPDTSNWKKGVEYAPADTGDDFPDEYDTVIAVEDVDIDENGGFHIHPDYEFVKGDAIRQPGTMVAKGDPVMPANTKITPELMASLAVCGIRIVPVIKTFKIAYIPTGNELVPTGTVPKRGENVEANGIMLSSMAKLLGAEVIRFPIIMDNKEQLEAALDQALAIADAVILNGGSSKGGEDFNATIIEKRASYFMHGVRAVPGRPVGRGIIDGRLVLNFPGPVLATWLASEWLLRGVINQYYGLPAPKRPTVQAVLTADVKKGELFELLSKVHVEKTDDGYTASPIPKSVKTPGLLLNANGLLVVPIGCKGYNAGDTVTVELTNF